MAALDELFQTETKELAVYDRPKSNIVLTEDKELLEQAQKDRRENYVVVKENIEELVETVRSVVLDAATEVRTNPSSRMYETFSLLVKTYAEITERLIDIPSKISSQSGSEEKQAPRNVNTAVFVGTSENIMDAIKGRRISKNEY